jgi:Holliday junction DNA helicase RuvA
MQLFGFASAEERELFEQLLAVSGVGPKVALAIVSGYSPGELRRAIVREDADLFQTIPGIGKKTAQRVLLELKERIAPLTAVEGPHLGGGDGHIVARDALVELGYSLAEAEKRLAETDPDLSPAERVREALRAA